MKNLIKKLIKRKIEKLELKRYYIDKKVTKLRKKYLSLK